MRRRKAKGVEAGLQPEKRKGPHDKPDQWTSKLTQWVKPLAANHEGLSGVAQDP